MKSVLTALILCLSIAVGLTSSCANKSPRKAARLTQENEVFEWILFQKLLSLVVTSENGEYVFVQVPPISVDEYMEKTEAGWRSVGYSEKEIARKREGYREVVKEEIERRRKYKESGLYKRGVDEPIHKVENFPEEIDSFYVANDGSYVIGFNSSITTLGFDPTASTEELLNATDQIGIFAVLFDNRGVRTCSEKISDLDIDSIRSTTETLEWADRNSSRLDNASNTLEIKKLNGKKIVWDVKNCKVID